MQTSVNQRHGPDRGAVASPQALAHSQATSRRSGSALARCASRAEWNSLGLAHRRSLARSSRPLSTVSNLPPSLSAVAARRHANSTAARPRRRPANAWQTRSLRDVHRRQLQLGEKRGAAVGPTRRGKGSKIMAIADRHGLPIACHIASASPHETKLVEATVEQRFTQAKPERMIGDRAYDSDSLDLCLREKHGIHLISPHQSNRSRKATQDGRELRRYCRRWKIERLFAWLHNFRRLVTRWEYHETNFLAMVQLGCLVILLRNL
jgi:transposase